MAAICLVFLVALAAVLGGVGVLGAPRPQPPQVDYVDKSLRSLAQEGQCVYRPVPLKDPTNDVEQAICVATPSCVQLKTSWKVNGEKQWFKSGCAHVKEDQEMPQFDVNDVSLWQTRGDILHCTFRVKSSNIGGISIDQVICAPNCQQVISQVRVNGKDYRFSSGCVHRKS